MRNHRPNILKLATKISMESLTYTGITYNDPEYRILEPIIDDEMCEVFMHLRLNTNRTLEEVAKKSGFSKEKTLELLDKLIETGAVRSRVRNGETYYYYPIWVPGIMEGIMSNREQCDKYPDLGVCFEEYTRRRVAILGPNAAPGMSFMRVIPVEAAVKNNTKVADYDEVSTLIENAEAISVGPCSCRRSRRLMGEGCGHLEEDMCIYLNDNAHTYTKAGAHHYISKEEAYEILKRAEDNGLVHELNQSDGFDGTTAICNCCHCSCYALRIGDLFQTPDMLRTNYVADIDPERCTACGACVENCHPNALKLGKKLCSINPVPGPKPDPMPDDYFWGPKQYNPEFRTNRTDVLEVGTAPCKAANSASLPYQGILKLAAQGRNRQAYDMITKYIPFPAICGRVDDDLPERVCTRSSVDEGLAINEVMKFLGDWGLEKGNRKVPELLNPQGIKFDKKIAVIGAGPAGLACAYYLTIKGYPITVFEREKKIGGKLQYGIPSFDLDKTLVQKEVEILKEMGVTFQLGVNVGKDVKISQLKEEQGFEAVFLGVGASGTSKMGVPGQDAKGVTGLQAFMKAVNSTRRPAVGSDVVVLGGTQAALDAARSAIRLGAKKVTVVAKTLKTNANIAKAEGVQFLFGYEPKQVEADAKGSAKSIVLVKDGAEKKVKATTVVYDGQKADLLAFTGDVKLLADAKANLRADAMTYQTDVPWIFAGGDVVTGPNTVMDALVAGREAAISIHRFVHPGQNLVFGRDHFDYKGFDMKNTVLPEGKKGSRIAPEEVPVAKAVGSFKDLRNDLTAEEVKKEASRCLGCGVVTLNENKCVGCGICTTKCNFGAITLKKVRDDKGGPYFNTLSKVGVNAVKRYSKVAVKKVARPITKLTDKE